MTDRHPDNEGEERWRKSGRQGRYGEEDDSEKEQALLAVDVAGSATDHQESGQGEPVHTGHPLALRERGQEFSLDRGERHLNHGEVDDIEERGRDDHREDQPCVGNEGGPRADCRFRVALNALMSPDLCQRSSLPGYSIPAVGSIGRS